MFTPDALTVLPLKRRCKRYDGVIKLCPCLHFTCRDRNNVRALLRSSLTPPPTHYGCFGIHSDGWRRDDHICPFHSKNNDELQISVELSVCSNGFLDLNVWYSLHLPVSSGDRSRVADPLFTCPHLNLWDLVYATGDLTICKRCDSTVWRESESKEDTGAVTFAAHQSPGYIDLSDDGLWRDHCYDPEGNTEYVAPSFHLHLTCHADYLQVCIS